MSPESPSACLPARWLLPTARTNCRTVVRWIRVRRAPRRQARTPLSCPAILPLLHPAEDQLDESVAAVYSAAGRHHTLDGRRPSGGLCCLSAIAGVRPAAGRLPHDSGADFLSGRQPGGHGLLGNR